MAYCQSCATELPPQASLCPHCGRRRDGPSVYDGAPPLRTASATKGDSHILGAIGAPAVVAVILILIWFVWPASHITTSSGTLAVTEWGSELTARAIAQVAASKNLRSARMADFAGSEAKRLSPRSFEVIGVGESTNGFGAYGKFGYRAVVEFSCAADDCGKARDVVVFSR